MKRSLNTIAIVFIILTGNWFFTNAQLVNYNDYNAIITDYEYLYQIDVKDDSLSVSQTNKQRVKILNDKSKGFTKDYIYYSSFATVDHINAFTLVPKGKGYTKIPVDQFKEFSGTDRSVFYDDSKTIQLAYPSLQQGAIASLEYTLNYKNPRFIRRSFLQSYIPAEHIKVVVKVHRDVELGFKTFNLDEIPVHYKTYNKGKYSYYEWEVYNVPPYKYAGGRNYGISYFSPHVAFYIKSFTKNGKKYDYFGDPGLLYDYYYGFVKDVNKNVSDDLKSVVSNITEGLTDSEKERAIYYWVHNNIKYVAYEQGYYGFIPAEANDVFEKRYGDCKGMTSLIKVMMDEAGLEAHFTWVGTRSIPYTYEEMPLPSVDNHMVAVRFQGDSLVVLDGTFKYLDYGVYPFHIQGKEVLVGLGPDNYKICKVPVSPASYSVITDTVMVEIYEGKVLGKAKVYYEGFNKLELAYAMEGVHTDKYEKTYSRIFNKGNNKFKVTGQQTKNLFKNDTIAEIDYGFEINDYYKQAGNEIYLNLNIDKPYSNMIIDTLGTITPVENEFYCTEKYVTQFKVPEGYEVTYLPEDDQYNNDKFSYNIHYSIKDDVVSVEKELVFNFFILLKDQIDEWNQMIRSLNKNYRKTLVIKRLK